MTKTTLSRLQRTQGGFRVVQTKEGMKLMPNKDKTVSPATSRQLKIIKCGVFEIKVFVNEGQIINEHKICKRFNQERQKQDMIRLSKGRKINSNQMN